MIPTKWFVDVYIAKDYDKLYDKLLRKYGETLKFWQDILDRNPTVFLYEDDKVESYIICCLSDFELNVVIHESVHISWYLAEKVGFSYERDHEIQAYYIEYIVEEILKMKNK